MEEKNAVQQLMSATKNQTREQKETSGRRARKSEENSKEERERGSSSSKEDEERGKKESAGGRGSNSLGEIIISYFFVLILKNPNSSPSSVSSVCLATTSTVSLTIFTTFLILSALSLAPGPLGSNAAPPDRMTSASGRLSTRQPVTFRCAVSLESVASTSAGGEGFWPFSDVESVAVGGMGERGGGGEVERSCGLERIALGAMCADWAWRERAGARASDETNGKATEAEKGVSGKSGIAVGKRSKEIRRAGLQPNPNPKSAKAIIQQVSRLRIRDRNRTRESQEANRGRYAFGPGPCSPSPRHCECGSSRSVVPRILRGPLSRNKKETERTKHQAPIPKHPITGSDQTRPTERQLPTAT